MKFSYPTRWLLCWTIFVCALLTLVAGVFAFSVDWRQGLGLTLVGIGVAGPSAWWLRYTSRKAQVRKMKIIACLGALALFCGAFIFPWRDLTEEADRDAIHDREKTSETNFEKTPTESSQRSSTAPTEVPTTVSGSVSPDSSISETEPEPTVTVTEIETLVPPQITVYSEVPVTPTSPQSNIPDTGASSTGPEPSEDPSPSLASTTEDIPPVETESRNSEPQEQTPESQQTPHGEGRARNHDGVGDLEDDYPEFAGVAQFDPLQLFR